MIPITSIYKKIFITLCFVMFITLTPLFSGNAFASENKESLLVLSDNLIEKAKEIKALRLSHPYLEIKAIKDVNILIVNDIPQEDLKSLSDELSKVLNVDTADVIRDIELEPQISQELKITDNLTMSLPISYSSYVDRLWDIKLVTNNFDSYQLNTGSPRIKVGIIDSGIDFNHSDLRANIIDNGKSFVPTESSTQDYLGHGTMIAGVIAANGKMKGIGPNLSLVPYKIFDSNGAKSSWVIEAIVEATKDDMDVINLSMSTFKSLKSLEDRNIIKAYTRAFKFADKNNTTIVASAGNEAIDIGNPKLVAEQLGKPEDLIVHLPGGAANVITVSATDNRNLLASYSNYGKNIDIAAPGGSFTIDNVNNTIDINTLTLTTFPTNLEQSLLSKYAGLEHGYELTAGTSVAVPKVAATVALIKAEYAKKHTKELKNNKVKKILYHTTTKGKNYEALYYGSGIVNAYKALLYSKTIK